MRLNPRKPTVVNYIMGIVPIPPNFDGVKSVQFGKSGVTFIAHSGEEVRHEVEHLFLADA